MKRSEREAQEKLKKYDVHTDKKGGASMGDGAYDHRTTKSSSIRNLKDAIKTFREGR